MSAARDTLYPLILSGGSGTRLWPMSRSQHPKQLLPLLGDHSLLRQTVDRVAGHKGFAAPLIVANDEHRFLIAEQMREAGIVPAALFLEPVGRNTAPAVAVAALWLTHQHPDALMLVMPSDHSISDPGAFHAAIAQAAVAARNGQLVTFGIAPARAETGYGYIDAGAALSGCAGAFAVTRFIEKPAAEDAERYVRAGVYFWNAGIFLFSAATYLAELKRLQPAMLAACAEAVEKAKRDADFIRLDEAAFTACPSDSIDYAVMERTDHAAVVPVDMGWSDLGSWDALWETGARDGDGNALIGNVIAEDARDCYLRSEAGLLAAIGTEDLVVVATADAVMVSPRSRAQEVRRLVARLVEEGRDEADAPPTVHRPWGSYSALHNGHRVQVKHIVVKPGGRLSLQMHHHRAEHWVVVRGTGRITRGDEEVLLSENQSTYIPIGMPHRLENPGKVPLHVIEVQSGDYLGEDDIVRFDDHYGRA
ncbi:MAG TPA: mannose-1-phosphate guanylyltransferase/mannose-6-phosphate isomerase [Stellaceae bacterium]|jgi:mannose-1-phosphate guanylyltransferase/mannose-6-phosphate isomerase|nr:mannose-1-phosphate guanylyltransferase/mannose-6-phosphate isomerase [Stellaceae bacterium]